MSDGNETIDYGVLRLSFEGPLAVMSLNDPDRLNAVGEEMAVAIAQALSEMAKPRRKCRALLIRAEGRAFCAGANLMDNRKAVETGMPSRPVIGRLESVFNPMLRRLHAVRVPVIVSVNGLALGIGLGIVLAADYVVASEKAWFQAPFKTLASAPDSGLTWLLPRAVGLVRSKRMLMCAEKVDAGTALDWGLVSEMVPAEGLDRRAMEVAGDFANDATVALSEIKSLISAGLRSDLHAAMEMEVEAVARTSRTRDNKAAVRVFGKKVKPEFTGE